MEGITEYTTAQGVHVLRVHYTADEAKRSPEFEAEARRGMSEQDFEREYNINFNAPRGRPWFPEFNFNLHVAKEPLSPVTSRPVMRSWDYGLTPATVYGQPTAKGQLLLLYPDLQSEDCGILAHGKVVRSESAVWFPGCTFTDVGDPAGNQRAQTDERSCNDILRDEYGINVMAGEVSFVKRDAAVRKLLTTLTPDGQPMLLIDPRCSQLIAGFRGGYQRKEVAGIFTDEPDKNMFSHTMDCVQYLACYAASGQTDRKPFVNRKQGGYTDGRVSTSAGYRRGYQTR